MEKSIKKQYRVEPIPKELTYEWLIKKHYAHKVPAVMYSFGLYNQEKILQGVCCYGTPANNHNNALGRFKMLELQRLVVNEGLEKNVLSFFVTKTFLMLPKPLSLISYADQGKNHHGYIYQATNWIYTGLGGGVDFYTDKDGNEIHSRIMSDLRLKEPNLTREQIANKLGWDLTEGTYKHRYFYFLGTPQEKQEWLGELFEKYKKEPYPKGENSRYDASYQPKTMKSLF